MKPSLWFLLLMAVSSFVSAQQPSDFRSTSWSIRNAFEDVSEAAEPAKASFTLPDTGKNSYLVNLGVSYNFIRQHTNANGYHKDQTFSPFIVFNRNTMIDREQNSYKGGIGHEFVFGSEADGNSSFNYIQSTLQYLRDKTDSAHSLIATSYYSLSKITHDERSFALPLNAYQSIVKSAFYYRLEPTAGLEFQDVLHSDKNMRGAQFRVYGHMVGKIALRQPTRQMRDTNAAVLKRCGAKGVRRSNCAGLKTNRVWPKRLELVISYIARYNAINTLDGTPRFLPLFQPALTYYPTLKNDLSIAVSYINGSDPVAGLPSQKFWQLAVQFQL